MKSTVEFSSRVHQRPHDQMLAPLDGYLVMPGLVWIPLWHPESLGEQAL